MKPPPHCPSTGSLTDIEVAVTAPVSSVLPLAWTHLPTFSAVAVAFCVVVYVVEPVTRTLTVVVLGLALPCVGRNAATVNPSFVTDLTSPTVPNPDRPAPLPGPPLGMPLGAPPGISEGRPLGAPLGRSDGPSPTPPGRPRIPHEPSVPALTRTAEAVTGPLSVLLPEPEESVVTTTQDPTCTPASEVFTSALMAVAPV
jgi:hypothetical protein